MKYDTITLLVACRADVDCDRFAAVRFPRSPVHHRRSTVPIDPNPPLHSGVVSLWRRFAAILYDCLALFAVCFVAGAIAVAAHRGQAIAANSWWFTGYLLLAAYGYFGYCWRRGQTLGMRSWKIKIVDAASGGAPSWRQTGVRFVIAGLGWLPVGLGFWWAAFDQEKLAWHDQLSGTRLIHVEARRRIQG